MKRRRHQQRGFTLVEMFIAVATFLLIAGAAFQLLITAQQRYKTDSQVLSSFQEARLGLDQIVRDISDSAYPPRNQFSSATTPNNLYAATPVAWSPGYNGTSSGTPCVIGSTCTSPTGFDLIVETQFDNTGVNWIRYQLPSGSTTLYRGIIAKAVGSDPVTATSATGVMVPYIENVMNDATATQITAIQAVYPSMFPGGTAVPIFSYTLDAATGSTGSCTTAANSPCNIRDVQITLIVQSPGVDGQSGKLRLVELNGRARRVNPNQ
jgi:type II secretory pathway pseudopilin PulG